MEKLVLRATHSKKQQNLLVEFLHGLGLKQPSVTVMKIFIQNKNKPLSYEFLAKKTKQKRSNLVKICQKLSEMGLIKKTHLIPKQKNHWQRAFKFINFSHSVDLTKQKAKQLLAPFTNG